MDRIDTDQDFVELYMLGPFAFSDAGRLAAIAFFEEQGYWPRGRFPEGLAEHWLQMGDTQKDLTYDDGTVRKYMADIATAVNPTIYYVPVKFSLG